MALRNAAGTALTASTFAATFNDESDPVKVASEDIYADTEYEAGGSATADDAASKVKIISAGDTLRQSQIDALYSAPTIESVAPDTGPAAGGATVTITGSGFTAGYHVVGSGAVAAQGGATVEFGGDAATDVVVQSDTQLTCVTPAHATGAVAVQVANPAGSVSESGAYTYE